MGKENAWNSFFTGYGYIDRGRKREDFFEKTFVKIPHTTN